MNAPTPTPRFDISNDEGDQRSLLRAGLVVGVLGLVLLAVIVIGIIASRDGGGGSVDDVTIAELRADPERYDNRTVSLRGRVESVRQLPYLDQYAIYTFRDDTGSMLALTQRGVPATEIRDDVRLDATYHSRVTLDDELKSIAEDQLGPLAGEIVGLLLPGVPLNVVFLEHERYEATTP
jgi:hypothetical protein